MATKKTPAEETAEAKFVRLATMRVNRALKDMALIGNLGSSQYGKTDAQVDKIETALVGGLTASIDRLRKVKGSAPKFSL